jgi:hypothetical protein
VWSVVGWVVSCVVGVAAVVVSCVVRPLDKLCPEDAAALLGSAACSVVGAVLCVVGVVCKLDAELLETPADVLCVVGVLCSVVLE